MRRFRMLAGAIAVALAVVAHVPAAPSDGGKHFVEVLDFDYDVPCAGETLAAHVGGWFKGKEFGGTGNRNVELTVFHAVVTYTNAAGDTFSYLDVGPNRTYVASDGTFVLRSPAAQAIRCSKGFRCAVTSSWSRTVHRTSTSST